MRRRRTREKQEPFKTGPEPPTPPPPHMAPGSRPRWPPSRPPEVSRSSCTPRKQRQKHSGPPPLTTASSLCWPRSGVPQPVVCLRCQILPGSRLQKAVGGPLLAIHGLRSSLSPGRVDAQLLESLCILGKDILEVGLARNSEQNYPEVCIPASQVSLTQCPNMIGSEIFIMVAFRCRENSTSSTRI